MCTTGKVGGGCVTGLCELGLSLEYRFSFAQSTLEHGTEVFIVPHVHSGG